MGKWSEKCQNNNQTSLQIVLEEWPWRLLLLNLSAQLSQTKCTYDYLQYQAENNDPRK